MGIDLTTKIDTLTYFSRSVATELGRSFMSSLAASSPLPSTAATKSISPKASALCTRVKPIETAKTIARMLLKQTTVVQEYFARKAIHDQIF